MANSEPRLETRTAPPARWIAAAVALALVSGLVGGLIARQNQHRGALASAAAIARSQSASCTAAVVADEVLPSVVTLSITGPAGGSSGSGETIRSNGYILTNDHVISSAAAGGRIDVLFSSGESKPATIVGRSTRLDLAVVKVDVSNQLPTIDIGKSETLRVGQPVVALGAPLGLDGTVTAGIISALGRDVTLPADNGQTALVPGAVQSDAAINPGNSGGALVDCSGRLIGVNTAIATVPNAAGQAGGGSVGIGFAIPVDLATVVADQLISKGRFDSPYLGMSTLPIPEGSAARFNTERGLYVRAVSPSGPADKAGVRPGDVITDLDGQPTTTPDSLFVLTVKKSVGQSVSIGYLRDGQPKKADVILAAQP